MAGAARVALLKVDVEGAEIEIIEGLEPSLWNRFDRVVVEYHDRLRPRCRERVAAALTRGGFDEIRYLFESESRDLGIIQAIRR